MTIDAHEESAGSLETGLAKVRHDLRTPLNAVLCFAQLLEMEDLSEQQREYVAQILAGGRQLTRQISELEPASLGDLAGPPCAAASSPTPVGEPRGKRILYVEDNPMNLELVRQALAYGDLTLVAARDGAEGLRLAREHKPDLVLLDLQLPDMSGEQVLRALKRSHVTRDTPVIILTADATRGRAEQLLDAGAYAYLTKPLDIRSFREHVDHAIEARSPLDAPRFLEAVETHLPEPATP